MVTDNLCVYPHTVESGTILSDCSYPRCFSESCNPSPQYPAGPVYCNDPSGRRIWPQYGNSQNPALSAGHDQPWTDRFNAAKLAQVAARPYDWSSRPASHSSLMNLNFKNANEGLNVFQDQSFFGGQGWSQHGRHSGNNQRFPDPYASERSFMQGALYCRNDVALPVEDPPTTPFPCQDTRQWDYGQCYDIHNDGSYQACRYTNVVDLEDFM